MLSHTRSTSDSRISGNRGSVTVSRAMRSETGNRPSRKPLLRKYVVRWIASYETPVHEGLARDVEGAKRQQDREHIPAMAGIVPRRQAFGGEEVIALEAVEVAVRQALPGAAPGIEMGELLQAEARRNVGEIVLGAGALDVAGTVGKPLDAMEA
jgi:hypothetical protein